MTVDSPVPPVIVCYSKSARVTIRMAKTRTISIPESVLFSAQSLDDLEDWLAVHNPQFLDRMRRIRNDEDLAEKGKDLAEILKRWPIE